MKFKNLFLLRTKSFVILIIGLALACFTCWIVFSCGTWAIEKLYINDEAASQRMNAYQSSFAQYVKSNSLSTKNVKQISNWVKRKKYT